MKRLDEREEIEPMLRLIPVDKGETPHGPEEIRDIFTVANVRTDRCSSSLAALAISGPRTRSSVCSFSPTVVAVSSIM
jgi:hypothetical protein